MIFTYRNLVISNIDYLYALIPLFLIMFIIMKKRFVKEDQRLFNKPGKKRFTLFIKMIFFTLLLLALANPFLEYRVPAGNVTRVKVLIDESASTKLYDLNKIEDTLSQINGISLDVEKLDLGEISSLGNSLLVNLEPDENILFVTDGQNTFGPSLEDVALFASSINTKVFGMKLEQEENDASISIDGPSKVVADVENTFTVRVNEVGYVKGKTVKIYVDDVVAYDKLYDKPIEFKKTFSSGMHTIKAVLDSDDFFQQNNVFYKSVIVYKRPKVLFITSEDSPIETLYSDFYDLDVREKLPKDLELYYAAVLNNVNSDGFSSDDIDRLQEFVSEGNGLLVVGGKDSYDWGDYNKSLITNLLPVQVGSANKKKDVISMVLLMDTGFSGADILNKEEDISHFDVQKSLVVDIIKSLNLANKVAMIETNFYLNTITGLSELGPKRTELIDTITRLTPHGASELRFAYQKAYEMLRLSRGSRNIVIVTDGKLVPVDQELTLGYVTQAYNQGIKTFIIAVGENADENFLMKIKEQGGGEYFKTDEKSRIKLYFGDGSAQPDDLGIYVYDSNHFITKGLKELGNIYGYNSVYPKSIARLLLVTSSGDPLLTIWNYGIGRVAALTTDDGTTWSSDLMGSGNSIVIIRTLNWLIEDPERKNDFVVDIPELRAGEDAIITVRSKLYPKSNLSFYEVNDGLFKANYYPGEPGFTQIMDMPAAVNYKKEYLNLGMNKDYERILKISGGELLDNDPAVIKEKILSSRDVETLERIDLSWVFVSAAILLFLIELFIRRIYQMRLQQ